MYHYPKGAYFRTHYDTPQLDAPARRLSCWTVLIYLSDGVEGGNTIFHLPSPGAAKKGKTGRGSKSVKDKEEGQELSVAPQAGRLLFHWHGAQGAGCLPHEGEEVKSGDKWVLRTDVLW